MNAVPPAPPAADDDPQAIPTDAWKFITTFIAAQSAYHDQKESRAYWGVGLFLAGAAWLVTRRPVPWDWVLFVFALVLGVAGFGFVHWQLEQRREAAIQVAAAYNLASRWLTQPPTRADLQISRAPSVVIQWPNVLHHEICDVRPLQTRELRWSEWLTRAAVIAAGLLALGRTAALGFVASPLETFPEEWRRLATPAVAEWLSWANVVVLTLTFGAIVWYSLETHWLRKATADLYREAVEQRKQQIRPFLIVYWTGPSPLPTLSMENIGLASAREITFGRVPVPAAKEGDQQRIVFENMAVLTPGKPAALRWAIYGPGTEGEAVRSQELVIGMLGRDGMPREFELPVFYRSLSHVPHVLKVRVTPESVYFLGEDEISDAKWPRTTGP